MPRQILVTSGLPYANGPIHIGHLVEYIQTDIWVRFQKLVGNRCVYVCADDTHGTAIMISAKKAGVSTSATTAGCMNVSRVRMPALMVFPPPLRERRGRVSPFRVAGRSSKGKRTA